MNIAVANFEDVVRMVRLEGKLDELLRDYREKAITDAEEIEQRARLDAFLNSCGVLEICLLAGFIPPPDDSEFWTTIRATLNQKDVRRYYTDFYPQRLPQQLRARLEDVAAAPILPVPSERILEFLALDRQFSDELDDGYFLRMVDSFTIGGWDLDDVLGLLRDPENAIERLTKPDDKRKVPDQALLEFTLFLNFATELEQLLDRCSDTPALAKAIWSQYAYWFENLRDELEGSLAAAFTHLRNWRPVGEHVAAGRQLQQFVDRAEATLRRLATY